ncbi:MAG: hypothetical protein HYU41_22930 [Candidatus Rokubacteria bacterium]|nr:hypothetical protein [Candidatus Rokubacteria bacterium]
MTLITGIVGIAMLVTFLGILAWWIRETPFIVIVSAVVLLLLYDFVTTLRSGENGASRKDGV